MYYEHGRENVHADGGHGHENAHHAYGHENGHDCHVRENGHECDDHDYDHDYVCDCLMIDENVYVCVFNESGGDGGDVRAGIPLRGDGRTS